MSHDLKESAITLLSEGARLEGSLFLEKVSRIHGVIIGALTAKEGSYITLAETSVIEGTIDADVLVIDGYVKGDIQAKTKVMISATGRVIGNIRTPSLVVEFGAFFEGQCTQG